MEEVVEEERVPQALHLGRGSWDIRGDTQTHVPAGLCTPRWLCSALGTVLWYSQLSPVLSGRGCSKDRKTQKHPQLQRTLCCRLQPEGGRGRSSARIRAANFPFPKNFTGIAGVKGQLGRFQRDASTRAGWAAEQLEGSILGEPTQLQAGTHSGTHVDGGSRCGHAVLCQQCWESSSPNPPVPAQCRYTQAGAKQALLCALWLCGSVLRSLCWCAAVGWEGRGFLGTDSEEMGQESDTGRRWAKQRDFVALLLPQLAPAEGKSHFFPDSGINYSNATRTLAGGN